MCSPRHRWWSLPLLSHGVLLQREDRANPTRYGTAGTTCAFRTLKGGENISVMIPTPSQKGINFGLDIDSTHCTLKLRIADSRPYVVNVGTNLSAKDAIVSPYFAMSDALQVHLARA